MDIEQLRKDYGQIAERIKQTIFPAGSRYIEGIVDIKASVLERTKQVAFLINEGLRRKGYESYVEGGVVDKNFLQAWVIVNGFWGRWEGAIIDFYFVYRGERYILPLWHDKILTKRRDKRRYKGKKLHQFIQQTDEDAEEILFGL